MIPGPHIPARDYGVQLYQMLRGSKQPVTKFLSGFCVLCPSSQYDSGKMCVNIQHVIF